MKIDNFIDPSFTEGSKIPWNEPCFSKRMLKEHLSQNHNWASRQHNIIKRQVDWIHTNLLHNSLAKILDLGCGPGFYLNEFCNHGHSGIGYDFSPASIEYAQNNYSNQKLKFIEADIRHIDLDIESEFDFIFFNFGEFNVFSQEEINKILKTIFRLLKKNGTAFFELYNYEYIKRIGESPNTWYPSKSSLFSEEPHLCLTTSKFIQDIDVSVVHHFILKENGDDKTYTETHTGYKDVTIKKLMREGGFYEVQFHQNYPQADTKDDYQVFSCCKI